MRMRGLAHSLIVCTAILKTAAILVPRNARAEWLEEWRAELWHVWHICTALHQKKEITAFTLGAFKDAIWLRRNQSQWFRPGTPSRCILAFIAVAAATLLIAYSRPSVWKVMRPNSYHDAKDLVMIWRGGFDTASAPTVEFSEYEAWSRNSGHLFTALAFYQLAANGGPSEEPIARASSNLFELLGVPI